MKRLLLFPLGALVLIAAAVGGNLANVGDDEPPILVIAGFVLGATLIGAGVAANAPPRRSPSAERALRKNHSSSSPQKQGTTTDDDLSTLVTAAVVLDLLSDDDE